MDHGEVSRFYRVTVKVEKKKMVKLWMRWRTKRKKSMFKMGEIFLNEMLEGEDIIPKKYAESLRSSKDGK